MPTVTFNVLHTVPAVTDLLPLDPLRHGGDLYMAGQNGLFAADETAWAYDDGGHWVGPAPLAAVPVNLRIDGATPETWNGNSFDIIHRVGSGGVKIVWDIPYYASAGGTTRWLYILQSLADGSIVATGTVKGDSVTIPNVPDGSYVALARLQSSTQPFALPPDNYTRGSQYQWGASYSEYWDYTYNVGKLPPAGHAFYALRSQLIKDNQQKDKSEWTWYLITDNTRGGEWSARLVVVGAGAFATSSDVAIPASGASLYTITDVSTRAAKFVDPLARTGNVLKARSTGTLLLAGQRMTPSGVVTSLWEYDTSWTLLGTNKNVSTGVCECALENHGPTDILEKSDGTVFVLTKCALLKYNSAGASIDTRLFGFPKGAAAPYVSPSGETIEDGFPGGESLREYKDDLYNTTENFRRTSFVDLNDNVRAQFYDTLIITKGQQRISGPGTRFHGNNDLENWLGKLWGVMQTGVDTDENSLQYITHFNGADWSQESSLVFDPAVYQWQRLAATPGAGANVLVAFGKKADDESGIMGFADGSKFTQQEFNYRLRRLTLSPSSGGDSKVLLAIGRASGAGAIDETNWYIIEIVITGDNTDDPPVIADPVNCEGGIAAVVVRVVPEDGNPIYAIEATSKEPDRRIEQFNIDHAGIWARSDSTAAKDDLSSYTFQVDYAQRRILPTPAVNHVDILFYVPYGCDPIEVNPKVLVRN